MIEYLNAINITINYYTVTITLLIPPYQNMTVTHWNKYNEKIIGIPKSDNKTLIQQ